MSLGIFYTKSSEIKNILGIITTILIGGKLFFSHKIFKERFI